MKKLSSANNNSLFMLAEKCTQILANFAVFAAMARILGPESFGIFSLLQAILLVGFPIAIFSNEQVLVKLTLDERFNPPSLFKHALVLKVFSSVIVYILSIAATWLFFGRNMAYFAAILCLIHLVNLDQVLFAFYRANLQSKVVFSLRTAVLIPFSLLKITVVFLTQSIEYLLYVYAIEALILGGLALIAVTRTASMQGLLQQKLESTYFKDIFHASWPICSAAILIVLYSKADQFMIKAMLGDYALGQYSAGVKISESSTIILSTLILSRFPTLLKLRSSNPLAYERQIIAFLQASLVFGTAVLIFVLLLSEFVIGFIYGAQYMEAANVLKIHMIGAIFIYFGIICTQWLIAEDLAIYRLIRVCIGFLINIVLNILWIPKYGIEGAAAATVFSQFGSNILFNYVSKKTRPFFWLELSAFNPLAMLKK